MIFPIEIHCIILDVLAEDRAMDTVKDLALTCRSILPICQSHIFNTLFLLPAFNATSEQFSQKLATLAPIFNSNPTLASYVRRLHFMIPRTEDEQQGVLASLEHLNQVQTLVLSGWTQNSDIFRSRMNWTTLSTSLRAALRGILLSPSLYYFHLDYISYYPIEFLTDCQNLTHLTIESSDFQEVANLETSRILCLKSLTFKGYYSTLVVRSLIEVKNSKGTAAIDFTHLTRLKSLDRTGNTLVPSLLDLNRSLESLTCTGEPKMNTKASFRLLTWLQGSASIFDIQCQPFKDVLPPNTLRTLKRFRAIIPILAWLNGDIETDPFYSLPVEFEKWASNNILEAIDINIRVDPDAIVSTAASVWTPLGALANADWFPCLRLVRLTIHLEQSPWSRKAIEQLNARRNDAFHSLVNNDKIDF